MTSRSLVRLPEHRIRLRTVPGGRRRTVLRPGGALGAAALVALLSACSGGSAGSTVTVTITPTVTVTPTPTTPSTTTSTTAAAVPPQSYAEALQHVGAGKPDASVTTSFTSPTGNISCLIVAGGAIRGCELKTGRIAPPTADFCASAGGGAADIGRVQLGSSGPVAVCNKDSLVTGTLPVLPYGASATSGSVACVSESIGVTCLDSSTQRGFFLARDKFFIF